MDFLLDPNSYKVPKIKVCSPTEKKTEMKIKIKTSHLYINLDIYL